MKDAKTQNEFNWYLTGSFIFLKNQLPAHFIFLWECNVGFGWYIKVAWIIPFFNRVLVLKTIKMLGGPYTWLIADKFSVFRSFIWRWEEIDEPPSFHPFVALWVLKLDPSGRYFPIRLICFVWNSFLQTCKEVLVSTGAEIYIVCVRSHQNIGIYSVTGVE